MRQDCFLYLIKNTRTTTTTTNERYKRARARARERERDRERNKKHSMHASESKDICVAYSRANNIEKNGKEEEEEDVLVRACCARVHRSLIRQFRCDSPNAREAMRKVFEAIETEFKRFGREMREDVQSEERKRWQKALLTREEKRGKRGASAKRRRRGDEETNREKETRTMSSEKFKTSMDEFYEEKSTMESAIENARAFSSPSLSSSSSSPRERSMMSINENKLFVEDEDREVIDLVDASSSSSLSDESEDLD